MAESERIIEYQFVIKSNRRFADSIGITAADIKRVTDIVSRCHSQKLRASSNKARNDERIDLYIASSDFDLAKFRKELGDYHYQLEKSTSKLRGEPEK
jgi:hypothetical protein